MENEDIHLTHCSSCFLRQCSDHYSQLCNFIKCSNECGAYFHSCKLEDHLIICPLSVRLCINSIYGCPVKLKQNEILKHLEFCPASVVVCTMEWNRWISKPRIIKPDLNFNVNELTDKNIGVAIALRDQVVLLEEVVPSDILELTTESKKFDTKNKTQIGDFKKNKIEKLSTSTNLSNDMDSNDNSPLDCETSNPIEELSFPIDHVFRQPELLFGIAALKQKFSAVKKYRNTGTSCKGFNTHLSNLELLRPSVHDVNGDCVSQIFSMLGTYETQIGESISAMKQVEFYKTHIGTQTQPIFLVEAEIEKAGRALKDICKKNDDQFMFHANLRNPQLYQSLCLNPIMECLPQYQTKQNSLYSFICNQLCRRDEYQNHFQNVHCEVYCTLHGWLEELCPYVEYGCNFSQWRFCPNYLNNQIRYDNVRGCLTFSPSSFNIGSCLNKTSIGLLDMPWEVISHILGFLDNYSLGQLTETCQYLREVCLFSKLQNRGIVTIQWEKRKYEDGSKSWQIFGEKWLFTNSFSRINKWVFNDVPGMSSHIMKCPFAAANRPNYKDKSKFRFI